MVVISLTKTGDAKFYYFSLNPAYIKINQIKGADEVFTFRSNIITYPFCLNLAYTAFVLTTVSLFVSCIETIRGFPYFFSL